MSTPPGTPNMVSMSEEDFRWRVTHTGRVSQSALNISTGFLFSAAILCFIGRLCVRIATRRRLFLDDYLLFVAVGALCGATGVLYKNEFLFFMLNAIFVRPEIRRTVWIVPYVDSLQHSNFPRNCFVTLAWTAVFFVKFTFFAFFRPLLRNFQRLIVYYWVCVLFTIATYAVCLVEGFYMDRYVSTLSRSVRGAWYSTSIAFTVVICLADIISDAMIVSIPFLLLRHSRMRLSTKISITCFLSLSVFMIICSIIRASGYMSGDSKVPDTVWRELWQELEACIAVMMASITVLRPLLMSEHGDEERPQTPSFVVRRNTRKNQADGASHINPGENNERINFPTIPSATFTGIRTFIRRNHRDGPDTTVVESEFDSTEIDYHTAIRAGPGADRRPHREAAEP